MEFKLLLFFELFRCMEFFGVSNDMGRITYNTRLVFQNPDDNQKLIETLKAERFTWNECSKIKFNHVVNNSIVDLHAKFYKEFRLKYPEIPSQIVIRCQQAVLSTFRSIKSNKHKIDEPPIKKKLSIRLDRNGYSYKNNIFSLASLGKRVKCSLYIYPKLQEYIEKFPFCDPLLFEKNGKVWISLTFKTPETVKTNKLALGIDLGIRVAAATSEGILYIDKKFNGEKRSVRYLKRQLQSKGSKSAKKHLKKLRRKEHNKNKNFIHHLANKLIKETKADVLVIENLKGIKNKKHKYQNKNRISQIPFFQLKQILTYKALLNEKTVIQVNPRFTSQIDNQTGKKDGIRKGRRYYSSSGKIYDSDVNASINIAKRSKHPVSIGNYLDGQAVVNQPIVGFDLQVPLLG